METLGTEVSPRLPPPLETFLKPSTIRRTTGGRGQAQCFRRPERQSVSHAR